MSSPGPTTHADPPWTATNSAGYEAPAALAVDVVVLTVRDGTLLALAVDDGDVAALPGGLVGARETALQTAHRKLGERTGLDLYLEELQTFSDPDRDPRGWIPTVAHLALVPADTEPTDPAAVWVDAINPPRLKYDHAQILAVATARVRGKLWRSNIAFGIHPDEFTLADARRTYAAILGPIEDASSFARDLRATGLIEPTGGTRTDTGGRPATLYRFKDRHSLAWRSGRRKRAAST
jgi:8-oxo-dGTP diphosphatase